MMDPTLVAATPDISGYTLITFLFGGGVGILMTVIFSFFWNKGKRKAAPSMPVKGRIPTTALALVFMMGILMLIAMSSVGGVEAQTAVPIPTLAFGDAMTSVITNANIWTPAFTPIFGIGYGIQVALALLALVGTVVVGAIVSALKSR